MKRGMFPWAARLLVVVAVLLLLAPVTGCDDEKFRAASAEGLSTGIQAIFGAFVEGVMAVYTPSESDSGGSSSGGSSAAPTPDTGSSGG